MSLCPQQRVQVANGILSISQLTLSDAGMYQCVAGNKHGEVYSNAELRVIGKVQGECVFIDYRGTINDILAALVKMSNNL